MDPSDDDDEFDFPRRRIVGAAGAPPVQTRAVASVFALAAAVKVAKALRQHGRFGDAAGFRVAPASEVIRDGGVVRVVGACYPDNRWTAEREEQERMRRARQRPPKPVRKARTRSKKLLELIGADDDN